MMIVDANTSKKRQPLSLFFHRLAMENPAYVIPNPNPTKVCTPGRYRDLVYYILAFELRYEYEYASTREGRRA